MVDLAETELKIGNTSFKGVYIAILLSLATTLGGGVWTASSLYSRLEAVEAISVPDIAPLEEEILLIQQELDANDVSQLQGKLAELGVNLKTIADQQAALLLIYGKVTELERDIETMRATVTSAELVVKKIDEFAESIDGFESEVTVLQREIQDLWNGMDYLSNPLR